MYMGESVVDESVEHCQWLSENVTPLVLNIYEKLAAYDFDRVEKLLINLLILIEPRGILTFLGFRKTVGS